ncbi:MAG: NAD(P)-dependent dehydrogenase (short-subunit alcohol dehydrogenase family) [Gammaproteobacteria bacterium]|jgi:NAD(P)-dependent dehydrogenase (short-subunit alcohol dehydrogenase family)
MDLGLNEKSVLITGGSMGIGRATAWAFAKEGASNIHVAARSAQLLQALAESIEAEHACKVHTHVLDLTDDSARAKLVNETRDVDVLVNNAGAIPSGSMYVVDDEAWRKGWDLKVFGYISMCRAFYALMTERGHGVIVNDIGNSAFNPDFDYVAGSCGNASLNTLTQALGGRSLDSGVRVVAVNPGPVDTGRMEKMLRQRATAMLGDEARWEELLARFPGGRAAQPEEVADLIVFLASSRAAYISGCEVTIDGGITSRGSVV